MFAQARALQHWRSAIATAACAAATLAFSRGGWQGSCAQCGAEHYPRTDPAVIVAVSDGERLLLGRQSAWPRAALFGDRRLRRARRVAGADRRPRSAGGNRRARASLPLPGLAAVAVPGLADARLRRRRRMPTSRRSATSSRTRAGSPATKCARRSARGEPIGQRRRRRACWCRRALDRALADRCTGSTARA